MREDDGTSSELILYQTQDGGTRIECRLENETVWLSQKQMADLFQVTPQNVTMHIKAIYAEAELEETATCKDFLQVRSEGNRSVSRNVKHYSLEMILAVGYRVRSHRGTQFRQWATARLSEYPPPPNSLLLARMQTNHGWECRAPALELGCLMSRGLAQPPIWAKK